VKRELRPAKKIGGTIRVPGDKSISHRAALISLLSEGPITVANFADNADCRSSLEAAKKLGVTVEQREDRIILRPPEELQADDTMIDCRNSGTTVRLLSGIVAGSPDLEVTLTGDESLSARPMKRIVDPLSTMGAECFDTDGHLPMRIRGRQLLPFEYTLPVASAQVKSALLLAGLASGCEVKVREMAITRDHTEIILGNLGEGFSECLIKPVREPDPDDPRKMRTIMPEPFKKESCLNRRSTIKGGLIDVPGDISTAAFFFAVAAISGESITVEGVGLNPTRSAFLDYLKALGCTISIANRATISGEPRGDVTVTGGQLISRAVKGATTVELIDEIPIVAVIAAFTDGTTVIRDAAELRVKESDRLAATADNLQRMGVKCGILEDGLAIDGKRDLSGADFASYGDHRIAMAFSVAALFAVGPSSIDDSAVVGVSCPQFYDLLYRISG